VSAECFAISASAASSATQLQWMSEITAMRIWRSSPFAFGAWSMILFAPAESKKKRTNVEA